MASRIARRKKLVRMVCLHIDNMVGKDFDPSDCKLSGTLGSKVTLMPKLLGYNCSMATDVASELGSDGNYTGFIGQLQRNVADFTSMPTNTPLPGDPVSHGAVMFADKISYTTMYERPHRPSSDSDVLSSLLQFDTLSWVAIMCSMAALSFVLTIQRQQSVFFLLVRCLLQYGELRTRALSVRILGWSMVVAFFLFNSFYSNFILTSIVRQEYPHILSHFFDILKPDVDIYFSQDFPFYDILKNSRIRKVQSVAEKANLLGLNNTFVAGGVDSYDIFLGQPEKLFGYVGNYIQLDNTKILACTVMKIKNSEHTVPQSLWVPVDSPYEILMTAAYSKNIDQGVKGVMDLAILRHFEHALHGNIYILHFSNAIRDSFFQGTKPDSACYSGAILVKEPDTNHSIGLRNVIFVYVTMALANLVALGALLAERATLSAATRPFGKWAHVSITNVGVLRKRML
ncbi:hypothetical protein HDE_02079 [Halotydeus destructor]|nr:hypothetical protein HDE_02079 [Halotydeus destructor]